MENKKIITHLSFTSLILIIIVTYSSLTLTLFSNPTFSLFNTTTNNITNRFTKSLFFFPYLFSSSSPPFDPALFSSPLLFKFFFLLFETSLFKIAAVHSFNGFISSQKLRTSGGKIPGL